MNTIKYMIKITRHICLVIFFCLSSLFTTAQSFNVVGCKAENVTTAFGIYNNELLYSYGDLNMCGIEINGFGIWNSINWTAFPQGGNINNPYTFKIYKGSLYAGGAFLTIGGKTTNKIARWNGVQWDSVGKGLDDQHPVEKVNALTVYKNELYVAGRFRQVDGVTGYQQIAVWNGINWRKIGGLQGSIPWVECMAVYKNELYVGGVFAKAGFTNVNFIARWNGTTWSTVGTGTNARVMAMVVDTIRNLLYVTGDFDRVHDTIKCRVAAWDGSNWSAIGNDTIFPTNVNALEMYHGYLYGGGAQRNFQQEETLLARWDGNTWEPIPSFNGYIKTLKTYKDELYIGGGFTKINNDSIPYLARYYSPDSVILGINTKEKVKKVLEVYPNPVENMLHIKTDLSFQKIIISDIQGKIAVELLNTKTKNIDISKLANGTYFINAYSKENGLYSAKFVKP
jgi:hypothetical protein